MSAFPNARRRRIDEEAAAWVVRHDRGLSANEQDAFSQWLADDAHHRAAFAEQKWSWEELDRLTGLQTTVGAVPDARLLVAPSPRRTYRWLRRSLWPLAAAAAFVGFWHWRWPASRETAAAAPPVARRSIEQRILADGSVVELNRGAAINVEFSSAERRVQLARGEAHFTVSPDPEHPFVVEAAGVAVRAVGTAFSVAHEPSAVSVLVTEGKVAVAAPAISSVEGAPVVSAGQRAVVPLAPSLESPTIAPLTEDEISTRLAWKPRLLEFDDAPLADIAAAFNRQNPVKLILADPALNGRRLSAAIRSDNLEGFVKLLESDFGLRAERRGADAILLHRAK